ncbi:unnamed protein product, partial [Closterium sp. NIES-54]
SFSSLDFGTPRHSPSTALPTGHSLSAPPSDESLEPSGPYPELVGCIIHRPEHWEASKRVLRYLCSTSCMGLVLGGRGPVVLTGHADACWVDDLATQRSSQGYTFILGFGSVSWRSTRSLVSTAALHDAMVTTTTPVGQRVSICTCTRTGRHLATFTRWPGSSQYTLATQPPQVAASAQVSASGSVATPCSCRLLSHQTFLWHHHLGHPSLPRLRGMHSRLLVSGLPRSLPPLPPSPAPPCLPCVEGRQRAAPHSSSFPPTTAPLQTLHVGVWGPARVSGQGRERYFLLVVDDYTRYTMVFALRGKGEVSDVLITWIRAVRLQLRERFREDLPVLRLHFDRGGEFSSDFLRDFCHGEGILQSFTLPDSPQQNGIAERRIGLVMEIARTSMIHAAAPHFLWPFAVRYAAHQLNLWPWVSLPETSSTLRWTGEDVTFDESVPFYRPFPYRSAPPPPPPLFLAPGPPSIDPLPTQGHAPSSVSQVDPLPSTVPVEIAVGSGAARGAASGSATSGGAKPRGAESGGAEPASGAWGGAAGAGVSAAGDTGAGGVGVAAGAGGTGGAAAASPRGARTRGTRAAGTGSVGGAGAGDPGVQRSELNEAIKK